MKTLQDLVDSAVAKCGGQSELAREIKRRFGVDASQQAVEYLQKRRGKLARRSSLTPFIAEIAGMPATWTPGKPQREKPRAPRTNLDERDPLHRSRMVKIKVTETGKVEKVELTKQALMVARMFMDLDADDRAQVVKALEMLEVKRRALKGKTAPDEQAYKGAPAPGGAKKTAAKAK